MAHFARLNDVNVVLEVLTIHNNELKDAQGNEQESLGIAFCQGLYGGNWKQTSYNASFRKNYAGKDYTYDAVRDAFIPPKPHASWLLDESTCTWQPPTPYPSGGVYHWDEATLSWLLITSV